MKKTLIALAAAATVSLAALGSASAASTTALDVTAQNGAVQNVGHHFGFRYGYGFRYYGGYGYGYGYCKDLYYKGWVLDFYWARVKYYNHCTYRSY